MDPLKNFLGHLHPSLTKPDLLQWLGSEVHEAPAHVYMVPGRPGRLRCACIVFSTQQGAASLVSLTGLADPAVTPDALTAQRGHHGGLQC